MLVDFCKLLSFLNEERKKTIRIKIFLGTALTDLKTNAEIKGSEIVINGQKRWMSGGGESDMIVFTKFGKEGIGAIYVPLETKGVTPGKRETLLGFRGIPSADLFFDNVIVPIENLILPPGNFGKLMSVFNLERCGIFNLKIDLFSDFSYC